jgi:hypothetical protein
MAVQSVKKRGSNGQAQQPATATARMPVFKEGRPLGRKPKKEAHLLASNLGFCARLSSPQAWNIRTAVEWCGVVLVVSRGGERRKGMMGSWGRRSGEASFDTAHVRKAVWVYDMWTHRSWVSAGGHMSVKRKAGEWAWDGVRVFPTILMTRQSTESWGQVTRIMGPVAPRHS